MSLSTEQVQIIRSTVPVLKEHGNAITTHFYDTLLSEKPALNNVFNQANQANNHQASALAGALCAYASHIDDLGALSPAVEKICQKHASLYIQPEHYAVVGEYLLRAMGEVLGSALTEEILDAWGTAYWQLANIMIKKEEGLMSEKSGWTDWRGFKIADKVKESEEITSFYLKPLDGQKLPSFRPGQYISVMTDVPHLHYLQSRQYSLSDAPKDDYYRISVKKEAGINVKDPDAAAHPGTISNILHDEKSVGDILKVSHPAGEFFLDLEKDTEPPTVLLAAGVGLTPMMSILNALADRGSQQRISFIHGARSSTVRAFASHVQGLASRHPNIKCTFFAKNADPSLDVEGRDYHQAGRLRLSKLDPSEDLFLDDKTTQYFVCGPESFMADVEKGLMDMGVDQERIKMEVFGTGEIPRN